MYSECVFELHITVYSKKIIHFFTKMLLWQIFIAIKNKTSLGLHVICPIFLSNFNQTWNFSRHSHKSPQYQIS